MIFKRKPKKVTKTFEPLVKRLPGETYWQCFKRQVHEAFNPPVKPCLSRVEWLMLIAFFVLFFVQMNAHIFWKG
jgi:hypothetical protein